MYGDVRVGSCHASVVEGVHFDDTHDAVVVSVRPNARGAEPLWPVRPPIAGL